MERPPWLKRMDNLPSMANEELIEKLKRGVEEWNAPWKHRKDLPIYVSSGFVLFLLFQ